MTSLEDPCRRCTHRRHEHLHHRPGTDCGAPDCTCRAYRRPWRLR